MDLLAAEQIFALRMNSGGLKDHTGRVVKFGIKGCADVLAFPQCLPPLWIEAKAPGVGRQSEAQKSFQAQVEAEGHIYLLIDDVGQLQEWLKGAP